MIDLSGMRGVYVFEEEVTTSGSSIFGKEKVEKRYFARVEGGAQWRDVDRETSRFGLAVPAGLISTTGVVS
jgi:hypothetical protein